MHIGMTHGSRGGEVTRLHRVLAAAGLVVERGEVDDEHFGPKTLAVLHELQRRRGLPIVDEIDETMLAVLVEIEQAITINIYQSFPSVPKPRERAGRVTGKLVDGDGAPLARRRIAVFARALRTEARVGEAETDARGQYEVSYQRNAPLSLFARAYGADGTQLAESATVFATPVQVVLDLTTAADGVVRSPSRFTALAACVTTELCGTPLEDLKQNVDHDELRLLANLVGASFTEVAYLYLGRVIGEAHALRTETLFALFDEGIPAALDVALATPPDSGLDAAFAVQVLAGVLAHERGSLAVALAAAVAANVVPASYADVSAGELDCLDALRVRAVRAQPYVRGKTPLGELLDAGGVPEDAKSAFASAYADNAGRLGPTWKALRADKTLSADALVALNTTLSVGELLTGNLPLVKDTLARLAQRTLARVSDLALLDQAAWVARITELDPDAASVRQLLPDDTAAQRIARFAQTLEERFARRYPTTAVRGGLQRATASAFETRAELVTVLAAHPTLELKRGSLDAFVRDYQVAISAPGLRDLKTMQRLLRLSPHYASVEALKRAGYASAQSVYFAGREPFLAQMTESLGNAGMARMAFARAQMTYASTLALFTRHNRTLNSTPISALQPPTQTADALQGMPDLQALFGPLDYFECSDCQSVYSPAAYLVDLLQYLKQFKVSPLAGAPAPIASLANARDALLFRRPEIQNIALDCNNTDVTLPYIDLANEILEAFIAPPSPPPIVIDTAGTSAERRALPQSFSTAAYDLTRGAVFPLSLPFDLAFAQTNGYLAAMGLPRSAIMALFAGGPGGPGDAAIAGATLDINAAMQAVITGTDAHAPWERWGFASKIPTGVLDPKTRTPFDPADWVAALARVPVLLQRGGLSLGQLYQLLEVTWVTHAAVSLQLGVDGSGVVSADTELMAFTGLTADVLDRAQRFLRLAAATGLAYWELDWALGHANALDDHFLRFLANAIAVKTQLALPLQEVLCFWGPLETRDVTNHLDDKDIVQPSTYSEVFASPTLPASWAAVFPPVASQPPGTFALGGGAILPPQAVPTPDQSANLNGTMAALGISGDDVAAILTATTPPTPNTLTLDTVNVLLRYARLASALALPVADLVLWIELTAATPFGTGPADTLEFLRRLAVLRGTGLGVRDLDYLLRDGAAAQSALAFTAQQSTTLLQGIRDAIAKLTPAQAADAPTIETVVVAALATATGTTANVVIPVLDKTGALPLHAATIAKLLASPTADPTQFPALVAAFATVARAAALYTAVGASETEFAFLVQGAATFAWLDPSALPSGAKSPYERFEALLRALALNRRQAARSPKLFGVLGAWLAPGQLPPDVATALAGTATVPPLAGALDASVADVTAIATALGTLAPGLTAATRPGSLGDVGTLAAIGAALDAVARYSMRGTTLVLLASGAPEAGTAAAASGAFQAQYPQSAWFGAVQPVEDDLRQRRRDALVAYLLGPGASLAPMYTFFSADDVYDYFLIDPEMCACALSTRLLQASLAIQQYVQQAFLALTIQASVNTTAAPWSEWSWRQQYRLWQANREVFLYPENYVLPELRRDASPFFEDLESDLRQTSCDADLAETAYQGYLRKLVETSRLVVAAHYNETKAGGSIVLHVFAHTRGTPFKWFYRTRTRLAAGATGVWTAWQKLELDIPTDQVVPVIWDRHLHLVWAIFKPESEKQRDQSVPDVNAGGSSSAPAKFWAIDFAMSELSAGVWQPKRVLGEKMFFSKTLPGLDVNLLDRPPHAFTFRAAESATHDLVISAYYNVTAAETIVQGLLGTLVAAPLVGVGTLSMPEAPMHVVEESTQVNVLPPADLVDVSQEPTYALVTSAKLSGSLTSPTSYNFSGQDLLCGNWWQPNTGTVKLNVLSQTTATGTPATVELLGRIVNPRIVVPPQEAVFDALDPFFVIDGGGGANGEPRPTRTYLVDPEFYTVSSSPRELDTLAYQTQWTTRFAFETFYHPYARTLLRELEIGGLPQMMARSLQTDPQAVRGWSTPFDFATLFQPQPPVVRPYPGQPTAEDVGETALDFSPGSTGAYALYNWELFYHGPMFVASLLAANQQYSDAMAWLAYVFNPSDASSSPAPQRFWQTAPFFALNAQDWTAQQIQTMLTDLAEGKSDASTAAQLATWMADPFDPHAIASLRISAYGKATVMKFLDNLIAWGDSLFTTYTAETVGQAEQLYVLADLILGPAPDEVRMPPSAATQPITYAEIESKLDAVSNTLVAIENLVVAPIPPQDVIDGTGAQPSLPSLPGSGQSLFFCVPPNDQLLAYWTTVADRLYKIRHCLNLQGQAVPLPLYAPPINPLLAAQAAAAGQTPSGLGPTAPIYRFTTYLQKAVELTNDVRTFGTLILAALEKKDAEALALLHANQELDLQTALLDVKQQMIDEANAQVVALTNQKAVAKLRHDFYSQVQFMNAWETQAMALQTLALALNGSAIPLDQSASSDHLWPSFSVGVSGFGGTPNVGASWGGSNLAASAGASASATRGSAGLLTSLASMVSTVGQFSRRMDDWQLQASVAQAEMTQIDSQIAVANERVAIAASEYKIQNQQITNAGNVRDFLANKYTQTQLYDWMITQLTTVYAQAYQLAYGLAQQAQRAYQYELGRYLDSFIQFGYWDNQHRGLTAGDSLLFDLRRMEAQYLAQNVRELELTKHVSLALTQPMALVQLVETGTCQVLLDEAMFDLDHPGHYFRRLRNVALTIPCVTGPYTGVNANLTLAKAVLRVTSTIPAAGYQPATAQSPPSDTATFSVAAPGAMISTSSGQNDAGLFEVNLRDERWLPFEGQGAISAWTLELNPKSNNFDFSTITDVILHVRYTARAGIAESTVLAAITPPAGVARAVLVSARSTFADALYSFFYPPDTTATQQVLTLPLTAAQFPYSNLARPKLTKLTVVLALAKSPAAGTSIAGTFGPSTGTAATFTLTDALPNGWTGPAAILSASATVSPAAAPQSFTLTIPTASVPPALAVLVDGKQRLDPAKVEDVVLVIEYTS